MLAAIRKFKEAAEAASRSNTISTFAHITFDFAEQVFLSYFSRQVGPFYYKVPLKVQIFGICDGSQPNHINYLFSERETNGTNGSKAHGPNSGISMLHHYLQLHGNKVHTCNFHADNCVCQNKKNLFWPILCGAQWWA